MDSGFPWNGASIFLYILMEAINYSVIPFSKGDRICSSSYFSFIKGSGQLVDDITSKNVGSSIFESMDTGMLNNKSYDINQH